MSLSPKQRDGPTAEFPQYHPRIVDNADALGRDLTLYIYHIEQCIEVSIQRSIDQRAFWPTSQSVDTPCFLFQVVEGGYPMRGIVDPPSSMNHRMEPPVE